MNTNQLFYLPGVLLLAAIVAACATPSVPAAPTVPPALTAPPAPTAAPTTAPTATLAPAVQPAGKGATFGLTWHGHATFVLTTSTGLGALLDPTGPGTGYKIPTIPDVDLVTVSHEHSDHNAVSLASGSPLVLRGLSGNDWAKIDQTIKDVRVRAIGVYHDEAQGSKRGKNAIFVFEVKGLRLAHAGDLGHILTDEQVNAIGPIDVLLIPVGGYYTIDGQAAATVVNQLKPKVVIPMHYKTPELAANLASVLKPVDEFIAAVGSSATVIEAGPTLLLDGGKLPASRTVIVTRYKVP